jgi:phosphatidylinositol glycan class N
MAAFLRVIVMLQGRMILIVADGLRAEALFRNISYSAPFLNKMGRLKGLMGVAHTRLPTETRPCFVAMISGMYEDPSAITRGWSVNPVDFDTLFNQTKYTWAWGTSNTVIMFNKAVGEDKMLVEWESQKDNSMKDPWVFNRKGTENQSYSNQFCCQ